VRFALDCAEVQFPAGGLLAVENEIGIAQGKLFKAQIVTVIVVLAAAPVPVK